jgi:hypothetical protein
MLDGAGSELLAVIVLPVLVGFVWLLVVVIFRRPAVDAQKPREHYENNVARLGISDAFDPDCVILLQSQAPALHLINSGLGLSALRDFFAQLSLLYPELYEGIRFDEWLHFLQICDAFAKNGCLPFSRTHKKDGWQSRAEKT